MGKDPEVKTVGSGQVANFSVATSESWKDKTTGEKKETTEWTNVVLWNQLAEIAGKYLHKGDMVYIEGKLKTRSWEKDGVTRYVTEVQGTSMTLLGGNKSSESRPQAASSPASNSASSNIEDPDLPF